MRYVVASDFPPSQTVENAKLRVTNGISSVAEINTSGDVTCNNINTNGTITTGYNLSFTQNEVGIGTAITNTSLVLGSTSGTTVLNSNTNMATGKILTASSGINTNSIRYLSSVSPSQRIDIGTNGSISLPFNTISIGGSLDTIYLNGFVIMTNNFNLSAFINQL